MEGINLSSFVLVCTSYRLQERVLPVAFCEHHDVQPVVVASKIRILLWQFTLQTVAAWSYSSRREWRCGEIVLLFSFFVGLFWSLRSQEQGTLRLSHMKADGRPRKARGNDWISGTSAGGTMRF